MPDNLTPEPPQSPEPSQEPSTGPVHFDDQIKSLNDERPAPEFTLVPTPEGDVVQEVHTIEADRKNAEIDQRIEDIKQKRQQMREKIRGDFDRSR